MSGIAVDIWENGDNVYTSLKNDICPNYGSKTSECKSRIEDPNSDNSLVIDPFPYPEPNPNFYAVLKKPGVHRYVMRGCFNAPPESKDFDGLYSPYRTDYVENTEICDDFKGTYCRGDSRKEKCRDHKKRNY